VSESRVAVAEGSGQVEIGCGAQQVGVVTLGGGLRTYEVGGRKILDGFPPGERPTSGRGQVLAPWPNRLENGSYEFAGARLQLPLNEPETGNAIHGLVRGATWNLVEQGPGRVLMDYVLEPQPGYPFKLSLTIEYELSGSGLAVTTTARNLGAEPCPYGCGQHPYLTLGTPTIDGLRLQVPGRTVLVSDERGLPVGREPAEGTEYDFCAGRTIGATVLDNAYTDLERGADGRARVLLDDTTGRGGVTLWVDESYPYLMVYSGDPRPDVARRSLAVEPMTCPANAFRSHESLIVLGPGESIAGTWGIEPRLATGGGPDAG
jgi:aldose 1-epimerase